MKEKKNVWILIGLIASVAFFVIFISFGFGRMKGYKEGLKDGIEIAKKHLPKYRKIATGKINTAIIFHNKAEYQAYFEKLDRYWEWSEDTLSETMKGDSIAFVTFK